MLDFQSDKPSPKGGRPDVRGQAALGFLLSQSFGDLERVQRCPF
jgi:hypothetical protein